MSADTLAVTLADTLVDTLFVAHTAETARAQVRPHLTRAERQFGLQALRAFTERVLATRGAAGEDCAHLLRRRLRRRTGAGRGAGHRRLHPQHLRQPPDRGPAGRRLRAVPLGGSSRRSDLVLVSPLPAGRRRSSPGWPGCA